MKGVFKIMKKAFQMSKKALIKIGTLVVVVVLIVTAVLVNVIRKNRLSEESLVIIPSSRKLSKAEIIELSKQWDMSKVEAVEDKNGIPVPVPFGFTESSIEGEDCVDTGFVIYKNIRGCTGEVNEENKEVCQKSRDQYVWIPVYDPRTFYGIDASGVMHGKVYEFTTSGSDVYRQWLGSS